MWKHDAFHVHDGSVLSFNNSILLWSVFGGELSLDATLHAKVWKLMWIIFTSTIWHEDFNELLILLLSERLELFEPREGLWFVPKEINPYFLAEIINKGQKIKATSYGLGFHGSTEVCMNYFNMFFGSRCGSEEVFPLMFTSHTILTRAGLFMNNW